MSSKEKQVDLHKEYRDLPIKKRVSLIMIARNLLKLQKEKNAIIADPIVPNGNK